MIIKLKELRNKGRSGLYLYIKGDGKPPRYFKFNKDVPVDASVEYYKSDNVLKKVSSYNSFVSAYMSRPIKKPSTKQTAKHKSLMKQQEKLVDKREDFGEMMKSGITSVIIRDVFSMDEARERQASEMLLTPLVRSKRLLKEMSREENMQKLKNRLEHRITFITKQGREEMKLLSIGRYTIKEMIDLIRANTSRGSSMTYGLAKTFKSKGLMVEKERRESAIDRIVMESVFRR